MSMIKLMNPWLNWQIAVLHRLVRENCPAGREPIPPRLLYLLVTQPPAYPVSWCTHNPLRSCITHKPVRLLTCTCPHVYTTTRVTCNVCYRMGRARMRLDAGVVCELSDFRYLQGYIHVLYVVCSCCFVSDPFVCWLIVIAEAASVGTFQRVHWIFS